MSDVIQRNITYDTSPLSQERAQSTLRVLASAMNNNTNITCKAVVAGSNVYSEAAVLRVQGKYDHDQ